METCEVCGRQRGGLAYECARVKAGQMRWAPDEAATCYRLGYEREKARADALAAPNAADAALDDIASALGCAHWEYPGQVVRDVWALVKPRPIDEWHEDHGTALWWRFPVTEPPYCGSPLADDFPDDVTHWTPLHVPEEPTP